MASAYTNGTKVDQDGNNLDAPVSKSKNDVDNEAFQKLSQDSQSARKAIQRAHMQSNIFSGDSSVVDGTPMKSGKVYMRSSIFDNSESAEPVTPRRLKHATGNPITGEGYLIGNEDGQRKENTPSVQKSRQPPGGYSTKLW
ncbi:hypothetical protein CHUAL_001558 [Chamberlinius hualienensis]